jgi:ribose-phosphate pyrophosphokinase
MKAYGAKRVFAFASHGLFSGPAADRITKSDLVEVVTVNTIPQSPKMKHNEKMIQMSVAPLIAEAIRRIHLKQSVSQLFKDG